MLLRKCHLPQRDNQGRGKQRLAKKMITWSWPCCFTHHGRLQFHSGAMPLALGDSDKGHSMPNEPLGVRWPPQILLIFISYMFIYLGRMNTQKKSVANSLRFWKYSSSKICPDPPFLASARRVIDLSDLWPAFIPVYNKMQRSKMLPGVISSHILRIWSQNHCILLSFYARGT